MGHNAETHKRIMYSEFNKLQPKLLQMHVVVCCVVVCCLLFVVCCLLFAVCCLLFAVCCLPFAVCRLLLTACCLLVVEVVGAHSFRRWHGEALEPGIGRVPAYI